MLRTALLPLLHAIPILRIPPTQSISFVGIQSSKILPTKLGLSLQQEVYLFHMNEIKIILPQIPSHRV